MLLSLKPIVKFFSAATVTKNTDKLAGAFLLLLGITLPLAGAVNAKATLLTHIARSSNISGHITTIGHPATNGKSHLLLFITQDYGVYNVHEIGVWYNAGKWKIFNQNRKPMPEGNHFNILAIDPSQNPNAFVHATTTANTSGHITTLNHALANGNSRKVVLITQQYGRYNTSQAGVWYSQGRWKIYNEDLRAMPIGTKFNVLVVDEGTIRQLLNTSGQAFQHRVTSANKKIFSTKHVTYLDHSATNGKADRQLFITQRWIGTYNPHPTGVWYSAGKWTVYNQNRKEIPSGTNFNVLALNKDSKPGPLSGLSDCTDAFQYCNYCVRNVEEQFKDLGRLPGGSRKPSARIRVNGRDGQYLPPPPNDYLQRIDHDKINGGNHIQGFNRIPGDDGKWLVISVSTGKNRPNLDGGFVLAHLGDISSNDGERLVNANQNRDRYKEAPPSHREFKYFYPVGGQDNNPALTTRHPGGIQTVGNLAFLVYKARGAEKQAYMDIWNVSSPENAQLLQTVKLPDWRGKKKGALYVAATRLSDGGYLALVNRGDGGQMTVLRTQEVQIKNNTHWQLMASPDFSDFNGWWSGKSAYQNVNFVTDCASGDLYLLALRQQCCGWNADNSVHLFRFEIDGSNRVSMEKLDAIHPDGERNDWCEMRGGSGIYVTPSHEMIIYCCRGVVGSGGYLKFSEHTVNR